MFVYIFPESNDNLNLSHLYNIWMNLQIPNATQNFAKFWTTCIAFSLIRIMRQSNCSAPIPPGQPRDQRKNACDEKGRGTRKKGEFSDYIGRGKEKIK